MNELKTRKRKVDKFTNEELIKYNGFFRNPFSDKLEPLPFMVASRIQVRLWLFLFACVKNREDLFPDIKTLFDMVFILVRRQPKSNRILPQFQNIYQELINGKCTNWFSVNKPYNVDEIRQTSMFLYSMLDFIKTCEFESDEECPIDLGELVRITDTVVYPLSIN